MSKRPNHAASRRAFVALTLLVLAGNGIAGAQETNSAPTAAAGTAGSATVGALALTGGWTRQTPPGAKVGGAYVTITNNGSEADRLTGGSAPYATRVEVHEMGVSDGIMRMRELVDGLMIEPGATVALEPGGPHLMMMGLTDSPKAGTVTSITLTFEKAGDVTLDLPVAPIGAKVPMAHGQGGHGMGHDTGN